MPFAYITLVARDDTKSTSFDPTMATLLIVLLVLIIVALLATMGLLYVRYRKRVQANQVLPQYNEKRSSTTSTLRRLTLRPSESIYVFQEKQNLLANSDAPPTSPVPEIRITFPEEIDDLGKRQSGRVVVVHVGESGVGLAPVEDEKLPAYQQTESDRFHSLDLERIGGLKEKDFS